MIARDAPDRRYGGPMAAESAGFWSYVHSDDEAEGGRISKLAERLAATYELNTATPLELFLDRTSLRWGDAWRQRIEQAVAGTTFFIPIITPRYFLSPECRRELLGFWAEAKRSDVVQLLLPVYYVTVPGLRDDATDEAMALVASRQWVDLREMRFFEEDSGQYRHTINLLARRIAEIAEEVSRVPDDAGTRGATATQSVSDSEVDEEPSGALERLAEMEARLPRLGELVTSLGDEIRELGPLMETAAREIERADQRGAGFGGRLTAVQRLAATLKEPAARIRTIGQSYANELVETDPGVLTLFDLLENEIDQTEGGLDPQSRTLLEEFAAAVEGAQTEAETGIASLRETLHQVDEVAKFSRSLRAPLSEIQAGIRGFTDGQEVIERWATRARHLRGRLDAPGETDG